MERTRKWGARLAVVVGAALVAPVLIGLVGAGASPRRPGGPEGPGAAGYNAYLRDLCDHEFTQAPLGGVANVTSVSPGPVAPGATIGVTLTWYPAQWRRGGLERVLDCVYVDAAAAGPLSAARDRPVNDGIFARDLVVPAGIGAGHLVCEQGFTYGYPARGGYQLSSSPRLCFHTVAVAAPPPPPRTQRAPAPTTTTTTTAPTTTTTTTAPRRAAAAVAARKAPPPVLPRTGPSDASRWLLVAAGVALMVGGAATGAGRRRPTTAR